MKVLALSPNLNQRVQLSEGLLLAGIVKPILSTSIKQAEAVIKGGLDALLIALDDEKDDQLQKIIHLSQKATCPVALFLENSTKANIGELIEAGICTVVVDGLKANRIPRIFEATLHRYNKMHGLQIQLKNAQSALQERKLVDRAKSLLIEQRGISEPESYKLLQRAAMNRNCKISEIAQTVIFASEV